jgi:hypothetical protein
MEGFLVYLLIVITQISTDPNMSMCCNGFGKLLMMFHHCLQIAIILGSLCFGFHEYHLYLTLFALFLHVYCKGCFLTKLHNKMCDLPEDTPLFTLINHVNTYRSSAIYYVILTFVIAYDVNTILH